MPDRAEAEKALMMLKAEHARVIPLGGAEFCWKCNTPWPCGTVLALEELRWLRETVADRLEAHNAELLRVAERVREACAQKAAWADSYDEACKLIRAIDLAALLGEREES